MLSTMLVAPKVSVVVPAFNAGAYLLLAVKSLLAQSLHEVEILVIDDGSTDGSFDALCGITDSRLRVIRLPSNRGIVEASNTGLVNARAPLVAMMDADDIAEPERLELQLAAFDANSELALVGSAATMIDESGRAFGVIKPPLSTADIRATMFLRNAFVHSSVMFRADVVAALGGYSNVAHAQDYELVLRIAIAHRCCNLEQPLVRYRVHAAQDSQKNLARQRASALAVQQRVWAKAVHASLTDGCRPPSVPTPLQRAIGAQGTVGGDFRGWAGIYARVGDATASARAALRGLRYAPLSPALWAMWMRATIRRAVPRRTQPRT